MPRTNPDGMFPVVRKGYDPAEVDQRIAELRRDALDAETHAAAQERELKEATERVQQLGEELAAGQTTITSLETSLQEANSRLEMAREQEDAIRMMLHEASKTRDAMLSEAEAQLDEARRTAQDEAQQIIEQAMARASKMIEEAQREGESALAAARTEQQAFEAEAELQRTDIELRQREALDKLLTMDSLYDDLQATLKLVTTRTIEELGEARQSLRWLEPPSPAQTHSPQAAPDNSTWPAAAVVSDPPPTSPTTHASSTVAEPAGPALDERPAAEATDETGEAPTVSPEAETAPSPALEADPADSSDGGSTSSIRSTSDARIHEAAAPTAADTGAAPRELPSAESDDLADGELGSEEDSEEHGPGSPIRESTRFTETKLPRLGEAAAKEARDTARSAFTA